MRDLKIGMYVTYTPIDGIDLVVEIITDIDTNSICTEVVYISPNVSGFSVGDQLRYSKYSRLLTPYPEYKIYKDMKDFIDSDSDTDFGYES